MLAVSIASLKPEFSQIPLPTNTLASFVQTHRVSSSLGVGLNRVVDGKPQLRTSRSGVLANKAHHLVGRMHSTNLNNQRTRISRCGALSGFALRLSLILCA